MFQITSIRFPAAVVEVGEEPDDEDITTGVLREIDPVFVNPFPMGNPMDSVERHRETFPGCTSYSTDELFCTHFPAVFYPPIHKYSNAR